MDLKDFCSSLKALFPAVTVCNQNRVNCDLLNELVTNCTNNTSDCYDSEQLAILTRLSIGACTQVSGSPRGNTGSKSDPQEDTEPKSDPPVAEPQSDPLNSEQNQEREKRSISQTSERNVSKYPSIGFGELYPLESTLNLFSFMQLKKYVQN